jgi:hypothetical protein
VEYAYLVIFSIGFFMTAFSFVFGHVGHFGHLGHVGHVGHVGHGGGHPSADGAGSHLAAMFNSGSVMVFIALFGGTGYILTDLGLPWPVALVGALLVGMTFAIVVGALMVRLVIDSARSEMDPRAYDVVGQIGRVTVAVAADRTGELVFRQAGRIRSLGARSVTGRAIPRDTEVMVTAFDRDRSIALVQPWEEVLHGGSTPVTPAGRDAPAT